MKVPGPPPRLHADSLLALLMTARRALSSGSIRGRGLRVGAPAAAPPLRHTRALLYYRACASATASATQQLGRRRARLPDGPGVRAALGLALLAQTMARASQRLRRPPPPALPRPPAAKNAPRPPAAPAPGRRHRRARDAPHRAADEASSAYRASPPRPTGAAHLLRRLLQTSTLLAPATLLPSSEQQRHARAHMRSRRLTFSAGQRSGARAAYLAAAISACAGATKGSAWQRAM